MTRSEAIADHGAGREGLEKYLTITNAARLAWATVFFVCCALNFSAGYRFFGWEIAAAFLAVAVLGAIAAHAMMHERGSSRVALIVFLVFALALGQWCGWQTLGIKLAEGAGRLESNAGSFTASRDALAQARAERARIGDVRPIDAIAAEEARECKLAPRGVDPVGSRCTRLRSELATARRAGELDASIPHLVTALAKAPPLADAAAPYAVAIALFSPLASWFAGEPRTLTGADVRFVFAVFFTALMEAVATLGPWLFSLGTRPRRRFDPLDVPAPRPLISDDVDDDGDENPYGRRSTPLRRVAGGRPRQALPAPEAGAAIALPGPSAASQPSAASSPPITIHVNSAGAAAAPVQAGGGASGEVAQPRRITVRQAAATHDTGPPPVDRAPANAALDRIVAFKAACLVDAPGRAVSATKVYRRYLAYCGGPDKGVDDVTFHGLFAAACGVQAVDADADRYYPGLSVVALRSVA